MAPATVRRRAARARATTPRAPFTPQLARLVREPPAGDAWLHELKYDGYRVGCLVDDGDVRLVSRAGNDCTARFPEVVAAVRQLPVRHAALDGEVASVRPDGRTSFQDLQQALSGGSRAALVYFVFDLLHLDGEDVARLPLERRKAILARLLAGRSREAAHRRAPAAARAASGAHRGAEGVLQFTEHVVGNGPAFFAEVCRLGLEGIVSKRRDLPYDPGRHGGWIKTKCLQRAEFVVGGFTDPEGTRPGIGALIVGRHYDAGRLVCAGKVGTGFTQESAIALRRRLETLETPTCPFTPFPSGFRRRGVHWVRPELVAEVTFSEMTSDGKIRQPSFRGLREGTAAPAARYGKTRPAGKAARDEAAGARDEAAAPRDDAAVALPAVRLTHPERVLYPDLGLTKRDIAAYYERVAQWIVPHIAGRPLTLVRCPSGVGESCFFMKHSRVWAPPGLRRVRIQEKTKLGEYLVADDLAGILALVQMDVLEIHTWNSTVDDVEHPNRLVLDLDPGPDVRWPAVVAAARAVRDVFAALGLESFVKTTGGVGLHVVVPVVPALDWHECLEVARALANAIVRHDPRAYTAAVPKAGRERKILLDYLRNNRTNTSVAAFSTRARAGAPISMPLAWDELTPRLRPSRLTVQSVGRRLRVPRTDPWASYWTLRQRVPPNARAALAAL